MTSALALFESEPECGFLRQAAIREDGHVFLRSKGLKRWTCWRPAALRVPVASVPLMRESRVGLVPVLRRPQTEAARIKLPD